MVRTLSSIGAALLVSCSFLVQGLTIGSVIFTRRGAFESICYAPLLPNSVGRDRPVTLSTALHYLHGVDKRWFSGIVEGGGFVYRGFTSDPKKFQMPVVQNPTPDLMDPETYGSEEAAIFFRVLDKDISTMFPGKLEKMATPSNGHLGSADIGIAASWGPAGSVWPLGAMSYATCESRVFWPPSNNSGLSGSKLGQISETKVSLPSSIGFRLNQGLSMAVQQKQEVLFTSSQGYLLIPSLFDELIESEVRSFLRMEK